MTTLLLGLCPACRHGARFHGEQGCTRGDCLCAETPGSLTGAQPADPKPAQTAPSLSPAELDQLDPACACGHRHSEHEGNRRGRHCRLCVCRNAWRSDAEPAAAPAVAAPPVVAAPASADPPAPKRRQRAAAPRVAVNLPRPADAHPAADRAGAVAVVGELDAVGEVAAAATGEVAAAEPQPVVSLAGLTLHHYAAWYCDRCFQRRHDPGACPDCRRVLLPVFVAIIPRDIS